MRGFNRLQIDNLALERTKTNKLLGINLDENLSWSNHLEILCGKMSSGIYAINCLKRTLPSLVKLRIYYSFVSSHLQYGINAWGPMLSKKQLNKLQVHQNNCFRSICNVKYNVSVRDKIRDLGVLNISNLIRFNICKFMYRYENNLVAESLSKVFERKICHSHNTRNQIKDYVFKECLFNKGPTIWKQVPNDIKQCKTLSLFAKKLKLYLLSNQ